MSATILETLRGITPETPEPKTEKPKQEDKPAVGDEKPKDDPDDKKPAPGDKPDDEPKIEPEQLVETLWPGRKELNDRKAKKKQDSEKKAEGEKQGKDDKKSEKPAEDKKKDDGKAEKKDDKSKKPKVVIEEEEDPEEQISVVERAFKSGVEAATKVAPKREEKPAEEEPAIDLDEDDEFELSVYQQVEKDDPKFKGVTAQYKKGLKQWADYAEKWSEENPDKEWNPDDPEHEAQYAKIMPKVPARAYELAKAKLAVEPVVAERTKELREENLELRRKTVVTELAPEIAKTTDAIAISVATALGEDVAEAVKSPEAVKQLAEDDPIAFRILQQQANAARVLNNELVLISRDPQTFRIDAKNNPVHRALVDIVRDLESDYSKMPKRQTAWKGRYFATHAEFSKMSAEEQAKHWVVGENEIRDRISEVLSEEAKAAYEEQMGLVSKYGGARKASQKKREDKSGDDDEERKKPDDDDDEEAPKPGPARDKVESVKKDDKSGQDGFSEKLRKGLWAR